MTTTERSRDHLLLLVFAAALLVRLAAAIFVLDVVWPDEHFQTLEPAGSLVWDFGWRSWEWKDGIRSWVVPALYVPVLAVCKALGWHGGAAAIIACRLLMVAVSALFLWRFACVARRATRGSRPALFLAMGFVCFAPAMVAFGAATLSDSWALLFVWWATDALQRGHANVGPARRAFFVGGVLLGIAFVVRPQTLAWTMGAIAVLVGRARTRSGAWTTALGFALPVCLHGLLDWAIWSVPFHSTIAYTKAHLVENVSDLQGRLPFHAYFTLVWTNLGAVPVLSSLVLPAAALAWRALRIDAARALWLVPAACYAVPHFFVGHKEARFLLPVYPALLLFGAAALRDLLDKVHRRDDATKDAIAPPPSRRVLVIAATVIAACAVTSYDFVRSPAHYEPSDLSDLTRKIREDGLLRSHPSSGLLLVEDFFVWTRGELMQGHKVIYREVTADALFGRDGPPLIAGAAYVITTPRRAAMVGAVLGRNFRFLARNTWGHVLLRNDALGVAVGAPILAGERPPPNAREIPASSVPADVIQKLYEEALRREPGNEKVRRAYADFCRARGLSCGKDAP